MATNVVYNYGSEAGSTNSKFKAWVGIRIAETSDTAYRLEYGHALYVSTGDFNGTTVAYTGTTNGSTNWSGSVSLDSTGWYADDSWINAGWYSQGQTLSLYAKGGYTRSSGSYVSSEVSGSYTVPTLYWTVSYNANGGSGAPSSQTKYRDKTLALSSTKPTRTGYTFLGWSTSSTATSATYSAGGSYTSNSGATLYAVWKLNTYTVSYNANGGSGAPSSQTKTHGTDLTLSSTIPTCAGHIFKGWATSSTGSVAYAAGATYTSNAAVTLYAIWEAEVYTISFDANGGSGAPSSQTKTYGVNITLSPTIPTREGYEFIGWGASASSTAASYSAGGSFTGNADTVLYAIWSLVVVCSIAYDANGGMNAPESQLHEAESVSILSTVKPTRDKYSFSGWALDSSATKAVYLSGGTYVNDDFVNGDVITLYAVWTREYEVFVRVPEGRNIKDIYVRLPKGLFDNNGSVYEDKQLETLDGLELLDSQDDYIVVRGV